ncbi:MAG: hypothetical protein ACM3ZT_01430 [Bacillota bacterium]
MKSVLAFLGAALLAASASSFSATPTPDQQHEIDDCATLSKAVLLFAGARDQGLSKADAYKSVTHRDTPAVPGSMVDQTEQFGYDHPDEPPEVLVAHYYGRCVLKALDILTPAIEAEMQSTVADCQKQNPGHTDQARACVDVYVSARMALGDADQAPSGASAAAPVATPSVPALRPPSLGGIGKVTLGMSMADARKLFPNYGERGTDEHGALTYTFLISQDHGFVVLLTEPGKPDTVAGVEWHGGAEVDMEPVLGLHLGDGALTIISKVGQPSTRERMPDGDDTLWSYADRNYSFVLSSGGDLIAIRVYGYAGVTAPAPAATLAAPAAVTAVLPPP